jgi:Lon protease-like protein
MSVYVSNATDQYHTTGNGVSHLEVKGSRRFRLGDVLSVGDLVQSYIACVLAFASRAALAVK